MSTLDGLTEHCQRLFASMNRVEQRRWGEAYVRGLLTVDGRKSVRHMAARLGGPGTEQSLQQFVSQSTWRWEPIRRAIAEQAVAAARPLAWMVEEMVFPKSGRSSVGVAPQYAAALERTVNCQLAMAVLVATEHATAAVNWRLMLPPDWDDDGPRRARAALPDGERWRPRWRHVLDAVAELHRGWRLPPAPVLVDMRHHPHQVHPLIRGLGALGAPYLVRISPAGLPWLVTGPGSVELGWPDGVRYTLEPARPRLPAPRITGQRPVRRRLLTEIAPDGAETTGAWLAGGDLGALPDLVGLARSGPRADRCLAQLHEDLGLHDFEGRSYAGWHHHVTLVSAAHAYRTASPIPVAPEGRHLACR